MCITVQYLLSHDRSIVTDNEVNDSEDVDQTGSTQSEQLVGAVIQHNDDALWGYVTRVREELRLRNPGDWTDPVLYRLFRMGVDDWTKPDHCTNAAIQSTRFTTAMASRLTCRIMEGEDRVSPSWL